MNIYNTIIKAVFSAILMATSLHAESCREVKLTTAKSFPITIENKVSGSITVPKGTILKVISIDNNKIVVDFGGSNQTVGIEETDYNTETNSNNKAPSVVATQKTTTVASVATYSTLKNSDIKNKNIDKTLTNSTLSHFYITPGEHSPSDIDASRLKDDLPGAHGWLTVKNGHLYNGDKRLRIVGVNPAYNRMGSYEFDPNHILEMKKYGFNGVRLWLYPGYNPKTKKLDHEPKFEEFDKFVASAIQNGMWIELNLVHDASPDEVDPQRATLDKEYIKRVFEHENPYTHRTYANEPALFCVELSNENGWYGENYLHSNLDMKFFEGFETDNNQIQTRWNEWLRQKYSDQAALDKAWPNNKESLGAIASLNRENWNQFPNEKEQDWRRFLVAMEVKWYKSTIDYIHKDLGYRGLVSTSAEISVPPVIADLGDIVRNQGYYRNTTRPEAERRPDGIGTDQSLDTSGVWRVAGKPFMHTEHNFIGGPNLHQGEAALYALTAATVQDWDGVFFFYWDQPWNWNKNHGTEKVGAEDTVHNSGLIASLPTAINLFRRGDLKPPTTHKFEGFNSQELLTNGESKMVWGSAELGDLFNTRLGTAFTNELVGFDPNANLFGDGGTSFSDRNYNVEVNTPKTVLAITERVHDKINLGGTTLEVGKTLLNWLCFGVTSLNNDLPIKDSNKILVTLIGQMGERGKEIIYPPGTKTHDWDHWQEGPCMVECISANVFIPVDTSKGTFKAYSLDDKAQKKAEIPLEITPEGITLHTTGKEGTLWYLIEKN